MMRLIILFILTIVINPLLAASNNTNQKNIAFTFDDLPFAGTNENIASIQSSTQKLLKGLQKNKIPAIGFVNEQKLYHFGEVDERINILRMWLDAGFELGNHTFSHPSLQTTPLQIFEDNVIRGDSVTKLLLEQIGVKGPKYFRHPYLDTGPTEAIKIAFEKFLNQHGYTVAPVTIEAEDWLYNLIYVDAKRKNDSKKMDAIVKAYLDFTDKKTSYFEKVSNDVLGYQVKQILLLHANELNADVLDKLVQIFQDKGYHFTTIREALEDKAYSLPDKHIGPIGNSWLYHWAYTKGIHINGNEEPKTPDPIKKEFDDAAKAYPEITPYVNAYK